jgi:hypothetical protein
MTNIPATLYADGQPVSTGTANLEAPCVYVPDFPERVRTHQGRAASLKLSESGETIQIADLKECPNPIGNVHWHFRVVSS